MAREQTLLKKLTSPAPAQESKGKFTDEIEKGELEDALFLSVEKIRALCHMQSLLEQSGCEVSNRTRVHMAIIMEEQAAELGRLMDEQFS